MEFAFYNAHDFSETRSVYLMNDVIMEFARRYVIQTPSAARIRYAKIVYVSEAVAAILRVPITKRVLTNSVEVCDILYNLNNNNSD